ncbi:MAG TPA: EAL domain-containing protein [Acidimicrobiia bacterium]
MPTRRVRGQAPAPRAVDAVRRHPVSVLLLITVLVATTAVAATIVVSFVRSSNQAKSDATHDARFQAGLAAGAVQDSLNALGASLATAAASPATLAKLHAPEQCTLTAGSSRSYPGTHVDLVLPDGTVPCSSLAATGAPAGATYGRAPWLARALASPQPTLVKTAKDPLTGRASIKVAARMVEHGQPVAVIVSVVPVANVANNLAKSYAGPREFTFTVTEPKAHVVRSASGVRGAEGKPTGTASFHEAASGTWPGLDGPQRLFSSTTVPALGWRIYAGLDTNSVNAAVRDAAGREGLLAIVALLALVAMAWFVSRKIVRPLQAVTESIVASRDEPMPAPVPVQGPREVALLATEFNTMLEARLGYEAQLTERALHDDLTQLPNRALLRDRLERSIQAMRGDSTLAVLFLDLDRFKLVNDSLGHPVGDALLQTVAARLTAAVRPQDTLARFGGDEFVVVCEDVAGATGAVEVARELEAALEAPFTVAGTEVTVSAKIGIALTTDPGANPDELVREADIAMYQAKESTRPWELWDDDLRSRSAHRLELQQDLRSALANDELVVMYQPIWDVEEWRIVGAEALVRWDHPRLGRLAPGHFIPLAEDSGQIRSIGRHVLVKACRFIGDLNREGANLSTSVNITVAQLEESLPSTVARILQETELRPELLCLELTESSLCDAFGIGAEALAGVRALGVHTAVDDFGTGYSSLSYFQHFPFDTLKIDRSFIEPLGDDSGRARALIDAIASMARALQLRVVAEGVETPEQLAAVRRLGLQYVQGFLLARPMTPADLRALVRRQNSSPAALQPVLQRAEPA